MSTATILDTLPTDPAERHRALGRLVAEINAEHRRVGHELHVLAVGDGVCPAPHCPTHGGGVR